MQFPIEQVPVPGRPQPFQQPQHYDPAGIIMQAAQLRQQRDLTQQQLQQQAIQSTIESAQTAAHLALQNRAQNLKEMQAKAALEMQQSKAPLENALLAAHAAYFNSQASFGGPDFTQKLTDMLKREALPSSDPNALPPGTTVNSMPKMGNARSALVNAYGATQDQGLSQAALNYKGAQAAQSAANSQQSFNVVQTTNSVLQQLKILNDLNNGASRSDFSLINKKGLGAAAAAGDPLASTLLGQASMLAQSEQRLFPQGSDRRFDNVQSMLSPMASQEALRNQIKLMYTDYVNSRNFRAQKRAGFMLPDEQASGLYIKDMPSFVKEVGKKSKSGGAPGSYLMGLLGHLSGTGEAGQDNAPGGADLQGALLELKNRQRKR